LDQAESAIWLTGITMQHYTTLKTSEINEDLPPMTAEELERAEAVPRVKTMRRALRLTQEEFAEQYMIPVGTLRDWEQGKTEPDAAGRAYLRAIRGNPQAVLLALRTISRAPGEETGTKVFQASEDLPVPNGKMPILGD
jgi:putative transcriptional regulator